MALNYQSGLALVPAGATNGAPIGTAPALIAGVRFYLASSDSVTFAIAAAQPASAPVTFTITGSVTGPNWDEPLAGGQMIYITAITGTPKFRFI